MEAEQESVQEHEGVIERFRKGEIGPRFVAQEPLGDQWNRREHLPLKRCPNLNGIRLAFGKCSVKERIAVTVRCERGSGEKRREIAKCRTILALQQSDK